MAQTIKEQLIAYSQTIGIDQIGFAEVQSLARGQRDYLTYQGLGYSSGFEEQDAQKRVDARLSLGNAKTVIAVAIAYPNQRILPAAGPYQGYFCRASWGLDYHLVVKARLQQLAAYLEGLLGELDYQIMVDTGSLSDRGAALSCGLGWIGRNSSLISPGFGSFVYLGELLISYALPPDDQQVQDGCGNCHRCEVACPLGAIDGSRRMVDARKCLAYRSLDKAYPEPEVVAAIGKAGFIYGCDLCQLVCPHNGAKSHDWQLAFKGEASEISPDLLGLLAMSNKTFRATYGHLSGSWRGKGVLQRNALFILGARGLGELRGTYLAILGGQGSEDLKRAAKWALDQLEVSE